MPFTTNLVIRRLVWSLEGGGRYYSSRRGPAGQLSLPGSTSVLVKRHKAGSAMQNGLCRQPQVSQGWLLLGYVHSYTNLNLSPKGPYDAFLASNILGFSHEHSFPQRSAARARVATPSHEGRLARQLRLRVLGCSCLSPIEGQCCLTPTSVHRGTCSPSSCKPHPTSTRPPTRRLLSGIVGQVVASTHGRLFPT